MIDKKNTVKQIFDGISHRYDLLNHILSLGIDYRWRKKALKLTALNKNSILLDVACGTGDFAIDAYRIGVKNIYGADFSHNMLKLFNKKCDWIIGKNVQMVAEQIPFKPNSFTNITVAFGVRNFYDIQKGFESFFEVLKPSGKLTILEFRLPSNPAVRFIYKFYFKNILPLIGGIISGDKSAYQYLPNSVEEFDEKINIPNLLKIAGFHKIESHSLSLGIVQVVIAVK
ncbi:MAG: bifunctional demethylmenaquinone methyltransferase/2-methoxy-6-polyprenyl-1,4-benzoquinol methylase UbiE [Ignavibacteriaceae bacterium]|nr:bifunctional demethylmenaquinone methyltransferase/2-methoxy-6-polyprenyl-1,4-benzoquinol methylase UbiE [Ignavibacteriaceae bacterium]